MSRNATDTDARIRDGFARLLAELRAYDDDSVDPRKQAHEAWLAKQRVYREIVREWHAHGYAPMTGLDGRPISMSLARLMGLQERVSEAAE